MFLVKGMDMSIDTVSQGNSIANWASIGPGQRFVDTGAQIEVRSKWSWTERLTGKVRLESNLKKIQGYLDNHPHAFQVASCDELIIFQKSIKRIQKDYYQKHWKIYIFLFGRFVHTLCKTLSDQVDVELQKKQSANSFSLPITSSLQLPKVEPKPSLLQPALSQPIVIKQAITQQGISPVPSITAQVPLSTPAPQPTQPPLINSSPPKRELAYEDIRHDPEKVHVLLSFITYDPITNPSRLYNELGKILPLMTEDEITQLMALKPNGFYLDQAKVAFPRLVEVMPAPQLKHLIQLMLQEESYFPQFASIFSYERSIGLNPTKIEVVAQQLATSNLLTILQKKLMQTRADPNEQDVQKTILTTLKQAVEKLSDSTERETKLEELAALCIEHPDLYDQIDKTSYFVLLDAYVLKEKLKDPHLDFLSFQQILTSTFRGLGKDDRFYIRSLAQEFLPLMEEKEWLLFREMWNVQQVNPHCLSFFDLLCLNLKTRDNVQKRFTQLLDTQASYKGVYSHIERLAKENWPVAEAAIQGFLASPLFQQLGFDQFLKDFKEQLQPHISVETARRWADEMKECDHKLALWDLVSLSTDVIKRLSESLRKKFELSELLISFAKQKDRRVSPPNTACQVIEETVHDFFKERGTLQQQPVLSQIIKNLPEEALGIVFRFLKLFLPMVWDTRSLVEPVDEAFHTPTGSLAALLHATLEQVTDQEFLDIIRESSFLGRFSRSEADFINFYLHLLPQSKQKAFFADKGKEIFEDNTLRSKLSTDRILAELLKQGEVDAASAFVSSLYPRQVDVAKLDPFVVVEYAFSDRDDQDVFLQSFLDALKQLEALSVDQMLVLVEAVPVDQRALVVENLPPSIALQFFLAIAWGEAPNDDVAAQEALIDKVISCCADVKVKLPMGDYLTSENLLKPGYRQALANLTERIMDSSHTEFQKSYVESLVECLTEYEPWYSSSLQEKSRVDQLNFFEELLTETVIKMAPYLSQEAKINHWVSLPANEMEAAWEDLKIEQTKYSWHGPLDNILRKRPSEITVKIFTTMKNSEFLQFMSVQYFDTLGHVELLAECLKFYQGSHVVSIRHLLSSMKNSGHFAVSACIPLMTFNQLRGVVLSRYPEPNYQLSPLGIIGEYFISALKRGNYRNEESMQQELHSFRQKYPTAQYLSFEEFKQQVESHQTVGMGRFHVLDAYFKFGQDLDNSSPDEIESYLQLIPFPFLRMAWPVMKPNIRQRVLASGVLSDDEKARLQEYCFERILFARIDQYRALNVPQAIETFVQGLTNDAKQKLFGRAWIMNKSELLKDWQNLVPEGVRLGFARHSWTDLELEQLIRKSGVEQLLAFYDLMSTDQKRATATQFNDVQRDAVQKMFSRSW